MLNDIGATDVKDALKYGTNAVADVGDTESAFNGNSVVEFDFKFRMRGLPADYARNYFTWESNSDYFNIERFEESRGPNSILFGIGSAGGIINASTKRARFGRNFSGLTFQVSSYDHYRAAGDFNSVVIKDKLALRLNLLYDDRESWRAFEFKEQRRAHLAGTYRITPKMTFRFEGETGVVEDNIARPWGVLDFASTWIESGRPTSVRRVNDINIGIGSLNSTTERVTFVENSGSLMNWQGRMVSNTPNGIRWTLFEDEELIPRKANPAGPAALREFTTNTFSAYLETKITDRWYLEFAFNRQISTFEGYESANTAHQLYGDPNEELPNRDANPHAGQLYIETNWYKRIRDVNNDFYRATTSYELDAGKLGTHRLAAMYEFNRRQFQRNEEREYLLGNPFNKPTADNAGNLLWRRYYFTEGDASDIRAPDWREGAIENLTDPVSGKTFTSGFRQRNQNIDDDIEKLETILVGTQSNFFNERIAVTLGFRMDTLKIKDRGVVRDEDGYYTVDYDNVLNDKIDVTTSTIGIVGHATPWLSFFLNQSENANLPNTNIRVLPNSSRSAPPEGQGMDAGFMLDLFSGKVFFRANYFTTDIVGTTDFSNVQNTVTARNDRLLDLFTDLTWITEAEASERRINVNGHLLDQESEGYEFELTANPLPNWRITASFSITEVIGNNIMPLVDVWAEENIAFWESLAAARGIPPNELETGDFTTLEDDIEFLRFGIDNAQALEGELREGQRKYKYNAFTRYTFQDGFLDGVFIGGGVRHLGEPVIGKTREGELLKGNDQTQFDLLVGYAYKFNNGNRIEVQLNVANATDETEPLILGREVFYGSLRPTRVVLQEPRTYRFTVRYDF
jgi:outer membrane receptor protein involved in Fe transport